MEPGKSKKANEDTDRSPEEADSGEQDPTIHLPDDTLTARGPGERKSGNVGTWIGKSLGKYDVTGLLGAGGMGIVFRAHDSMIERDVAIKLLPKELAADPVARERFLLEAKAAGKLTHPNVVSIYEIGQQDDIYYIVMELLPNGNASDYLKEHGPYSAVEATRIMVDACRGLAAAHATGLVHRDIKPGNLLRSEHDSVKVADFGLAKGSFPRTQQLTQTGGILGTPAFMSPEQCQSKTIDPRSDIYSMGATYYSLLTGVEPYHDVGSVVQVMFAHCRPGGLDPRDVDPKIPDECAAVVARAMQTEPEDRYQTANEMLADLEAILRGHPVQASTSGAATGVGAGQATGAKVATSGESATSGPPSTSDQTPRPDVITSRKPRNLWPTAIVVIVALIGLGLLGAGRLFLSGGDSRGPAAPPLGSPAPGITPTKIVLGTSTAYSGPNRELGRSIVVGIQTWFKEVNERGGVHGRELELVVLDDGYEPERALANMKELIEVREVFGVIGNVGTPTAKVTVPYALEQRRLFFAPYSGAALLRKVPPDRYVFNYRASYADETAVMVKYFVERQDVPPESIAVFAQNDAYGEDGFSGVARALREYGVREEDIPRVSYERNSVQVDEAVRQILDRRDEIQAIVMVPTYKVAAGFIKKLKDDGFSPRFAIVSFVGSKSLAEEFRELGAHYGEGVIVTQVVPHYLSNSTGVIRYRELLKKHHPEMQPGFVSLEGFIAARCLVEALERTGPELTTEKLVDTLESIRDLDLGIGPIINFGPSRHQASHTVWGTVLDASAEYQTLQLD